MASPGTEGGGAGHGGAWMVLRPSPGHRQAPEGNLSPRVVVGSPPAPRWEWSVPKWIQGLQDRAEPQWNLHVPRESTCDCLGGGGSAVGEPMAFGLS